MPLLSIVLVPVHIFLIDSVLQSYQYHTHNFQFFTLTSYHGILTKIGVPLSQRAAILPFRTNATATAFAVFAAIRWTPKKNSQNK